MHDVCLQSGAAFDGEKGFCVGTPGGLMIGWSRKFCSQPRDENSPGVPGKINIFQGPFADRANLRARFATKTLVTRFFLGGGVLLHDTIYASTPIGANPPPLTGFQLYRLLLLLYLVLCRSAGLPLVLLDFYGTAVE